MCREGAGKRQMTVEDSDEALQERGSKEKQRCAREGAGRQQKDTNVSTPQQATRLQASIVSEAAL